MMNKRHHTRITALIRVLGDWCLALPLCLAATTGQAAQHFIDMMTCDDTFPGPTDYQVIPAIAGGTLNDTIEPTSAVGTVSWAFNDTPGTCSLSGGTMLTCNGVTVNLPAAGSQPNPVPVMAGTVGSGGTFSFVVDIQDNNTLCTEGFEIVISEPYDLSYVIDRSGSMGLDADPGNPGTSRWDALNTAVAGTMMTAGLVAETVSGNPAAGSRFGLTLFSTTNLTNNTFSAGMVNIDGNLVNGVIAELGSQNPSGWTALGMGLQVGEAKMNDCGRPRVAVVFTDGQQNRSPEVAAGGTTYSDASAVNATCPGVAQQAVEVVSVSMIQTCATCLSMLQVLANNNGGNELIITTNGIDYRMDDGVTLVGDIAAAYNFAIVPALEGNSPQVVAITKSGLFGTVTLPAFDVNELVDDILIQLRLSQPVAAPPGFRVEKDGTDVTPFFRMVGIDGVTNVFTIHSDLQPPDGGPPDPLDPAGSYVVELTAPPRAPENLEFTATTYVDDHRLEFDWQVTPALPRVNEPFEPTVTLTWRGDPVENATVEAWVLSPGVDVGNLLANDPTIVDPSSADDAGTPGEQKLQFLLNNDANFRAAITADELLNVLPHQGNGIYSAPFEPGETSGIYQLVYRVRADDPAFGRIQRVAAQSVYTRFGEIDFPASVLGGSIEGTTTTLDLRPITTYGSFVGPGNQTAITVDGGTLTGITDDQDGSYTVTIEGDPNAVITISILGDPVYAGPAADIPGIGSGGGPFGVGWPFWILLLVILILIIWLLKRLLGGGNP